ncbi:FtsQ-type POTRA domain-containing protein [Kineosporia rhizophila]|uniref:cell division protein FtsQ/DivIB n=1 Tax=Kineosporia rhizophila TaxID=84633 RepID=UPI001E32A9BC|nr:FtsQ-type POTRA domain-containing protein [Kineosporia rhizophila]MCE0538369.1 FtsQ-type POTRA domain-containing protein [Kineosporia rhizophila]
MTPNSSSGPGRRPGRSSSPRAATGRSAAPRRKPGGPSSSGKSTGKPAAKAPRPTERKPERQPERKGGRKPTAKVGRPVSASHSTGLLPQYAPARTRPVVSQTSAQRFAAKVRARRRRRVLITTSIVLVLLAGGWGAIFSPWATVEQVEIAGLDRVKETDVRAAAETELGHSLLLARTAEVGGRVEQLRLVKNVQVSRAWPGTLRVEVTEREPVAALPSSRVAGNSTSGTGRGEMLMVQLVDDEGVVVETRPARSTPKGLPRIDVALGQKQSVENLRATLAVRNGLPKNLDDRLTAIGTSSPDGIWLKLAAPLKNAPKRTVLVQWGDSENGAQKAEVLTALLRQKARTYDVRAPEMPSIAS